MSIFSRGVMSGALVLVMASGSAAQTADEIVERHLVAMGGRTAIEKLTSRTVLFRSPSTRVISSVSSR